MQALRFLYTIQLAEDECSLEALPVHVCMSHKMYVPKQ